MPAEIHRFRCRTDNLGALLHDPATGATAAIDAPEEGAILAALAETGWQLTDILVTHRHGDHIEAIPALKARFGARIVAPASAGDAVPLVDEAVGEGDTVRIGRLSGRVLATPGHCDDHVAYWFADAAALFCGDTLFKLGCGRKLEGDYATFWATLIRLMALPDATRLHCGHDYALGNARFAVAMLPDDAAFAASLREAEVDAAAGRLTGLSTLGEEKAGNIFLRAGEPAIAAALGMAGADALAVFTALRERKNRF